MTSLVSLDGGNRKIGGRMSYAASYRHAELQSVEEVNLTGARLWFPVHNRPDAVAVERPDYLKKGVPPATIMALAWNVCRIAYTIANGAPVQEYTVNDGHGKGCQFPARECDCGNSDWIGGTRKPALHLRIWRALQPAERKRFHPSTEQWIDQAAEKLARKPGSKPWEHASFNTLDAAGVGLFHLGRIGKGGVRKP